MIYFAIRFCVPSATVEEFCAEDDIDVAHKQQNIFVILPSALVLVPHLLSTDSKSFRCGMQLNVELPLGEK